MTTPSLDLESAINRIDRLERQNTLTRAGFLLLLVMLACAAVPSRKNQDESLSAQSFILRTEEGRVCAELKVEKNDPVLTMLDKTGAERVRLRVLEGGPALTLYSESGKSQLALNAWQEPQLVLFDKEGNARAIMGALTLREVATGAVSRYPPSTLVLCDEEGRIGFRAPRRVLMTDADRVLATKFK